MWGGWFLWLGCCVLWLRQAATELTNITHKKAESDLIKLDSYSWNQCCCTNLSIGKLEDLSQIPFVWVCAHGGYLCVCVHTWCKGVATARVLSTHWF